MVCRNKKRRNASSVIAQSSNRSECSDFSWYKSGLSKPQNLQFCVFTNPIMWKCALSVNHLQQTANSFIINHCKNLVGKVNFCLQCIEGMAWWLWISHGIIRVFIYFLHTRKQISDAISRKLFLLRKIKKKNVWYSQE